MRTLNLPRLITAVACLALIPLATEIDALASLTLATAACACLIAYETTSYREPRARVRAPG